MNENRDSIMRMARGAFVATSLYVTGDGNGELVVAEMVPQVPGQMNMDGTQQEAPKLLKLVTHA